MSVIFEPTKVKGKNHVKPVKEKCVFTGNPTEEENFRQLYELLGKKKKILIQDNQGNYWHFSRI